MSEIIIDGPVRTQGVIRPGGNKNAALPIIAAALLTDEPVVIHNLPMILDADAMLNIARNLGASVTRVGTDVTICAAGLKKSELPRALCASVRASILFGAPVAIRCGKATVGLPGGDFIGRRRLDSHYYGLKKLGISNKLTPGAVVFTQEKKLSGSDIFLDEASVTATEHILTAAVLAKGTTILRNAAAEPHVQQLAEFLNAMGADITGIDTNTYRIHGVERLHGCEFTLEADHIEVASFLCLAAATGGGVELEGNIHPRHYWMTRRVFEKLNIHFRLANGHISMRPGQKMKIAMDAGNAIPMISDGPWPQFPSDMMSCLIVAATQAKGTILFFEKMFESRIYFVDRLIAMGANAVVCDPHRVVISGPAKLRPLRMSSPDIRAGMAMIIAASCARGRSTIQNADMVFRGYENLIDKLRALGVPAELV